MIRKQTRRIPITILKRLLYGGIAVGGIAISLSTTPANAYIDITFPVIGDVTYSDDYNSPRAGGPHHAIDIIASKGQKVVSAVDGTIHYVAYPEPSYGYMVQVYGNDGYTYSYIHLNNDRPGTDDGKGGGYHAYGPDMVQGRPIKRGQLIGYVGDSGNAENTVSHLHFEIYHTGGSAVDPYNSLRNAQKISKPISYPQLSGEFLPYGPDGIFATNIADGNFNLDTDREFVTAVGGGAPPHVKIFDKNNTSIGGFFAYNQAFRGGVDVATANMDIDPEDEIITAAGKGGGPQIKIFNKDGSVLGGFFAFPSTGRIGVHVSAGDIDGDHINEIVAVQLAGGNSIVRIFRMNGQLIREFNAYGSFMGGLDVAVGDVDGDSIADIVTAPLAGGQPVIRVFSGNGVKKAEFLAYNEAFRGGVRIDTGNNNQGTVAEEIGTVPASSGGPQAKLFNGQGTLLGNGMFAEEWWRGEYSIAVGPGFKKAALGTNRRFAIRQAF